MEDKCGVVGIYSIDKDRDISSSIYYCLYALQHRGQETAGITTVDNENGLKHHIGMGYVVDIYNPDIISKLTGPVGIGHVKYSTVGQFKIENAQPYVMDYGNGHIAAAHNGDIVNSYQLRKELEDKGFVFKTDGDSELISYLLKVELIDNRKDSVQAIKDMCKKLLGAYSITLLINGELYAVRDSAAMKPLAIAEKDGNFIIASETVAFDVINANYIRDVRPGEIIYFEDTAIKSAMLDDAETTKTSHCVFEYVYFARPDSVIDGVSVYEARSNIGKALYELYPVDADVVMAVPDSSIPAAIGYSEASGIPYAEGMIKNRYVGRTFIMPTQEERELAVRLKLNPISRNLKGKKIVLIDDSIVRGTTSIQLLNVLKQYEPAEIHLLIGCPPVIAPCFYGVAMATKEELIAANHTVEEIREILDIDTLGYITKEKLIEAVGFPEEELCSGCVTEEYPTEIPENLEPEAYYKII